MKKSTNTLSKLKVISSLATLASIIMLVAAVPLFVNAQTGNPPTNVVDATFNSVRVDSSSGRELVIDGTWASINETSGTPVLISDPQGLALSGTGSFSAYQQNVRITDFPADGFNSAFDVQVPIENTTANNGGAVYIEDDSGLTMHSGIPSNWNELNIHPRNGLSATHSSSAVPVVIQDPEGLLVNNDIDVAGAITNGSTNPIRFWDSNGFSFANDSGTVGLSIAGNGIISNPTNSINAGFVYINDGLWTKTLQAHNNSGASVFRVDSNTGDTDVFGDLDVTGTTSLQSLSVGAITTPSTIDAMGGIQNSSVHPSFPWIGYPVSINDANGLSVSGPTSMSSNLTVSGTTNLNGQTNVNSNLSVTGNITSTGGIGSFYAAGWTPSSDTIPASSSEVRTASCSSGDYAIECMEWKQSYLVQPRYSYVSSDRCVMQFYNPSGGALYAQVNALCFSPDG